MNIQSSENILLTGAGFTKNFGGLLASEMWAEIFNHEKIQTHPRIKELMSDDFDYESIYNSIMEDSDLFSWDDIPENDTLRYIEFLKKKFGIDWKKKEEIEIIDNDSTIKCSTGKNSFSLRLNDEKNKVNLKIDNDRTYEFILKSENYKLNIYKSLYTNTEKEAIKDAVKSAYEYIDSILREHNCNPRSVKFTNVIEFIDLFNENRIKSFIGPNNVPYFVQTDTGNKSFIFTLNQDLFFERLYPNTNLSIPGIKNNSYLFSWDEISGNDSEKRIDLLTLNFGIEWVRTANIEIIDNCNTIKCSTEKNSFSLRLNNEKNKVTLKIDDGRKIDKEFIVKTENGKLNIYYDPNWFTTYFKEPLLPIDYCRLPEKLDCNMDILSDGNFFLIKLHGSYNWESSDGTQKMVIGRGKNEQIQKEPLLRYYFDIFEKVLSQNQRRLFIIGYGFNDKHINRIISNAVRNHKLKIYVISLDKPEDFKKKLYEKPELGIAIWREISGYFQYSLKDIFSEDTRKNKAIKQHFYDIAKLE